MDLHFETTDVANRYVTAMKAQHSMRKVFEKQRV